MDANGRYTNNYDEAINSFVNASILVANYYDYKGNYFIDEEDVKYSMNSFGSFSRFFLTFWNCTSLESIIIPESVIDFGYGIFYIDGNRPHHEGFKIYFHSQEQKELFLKRNFSIDKYCVVI